jgi:hypothetical protein
MMYFNDGNIRYEVELVSGSQSGDSYLFNIRKTVFSRDLNDVKASPYQQREFTRRLKCDDNGMVYCGRKSNKIWLDWPKQKMVNSYNVH